MSTTALLLAALCSTPAAASKPAAPAEPSATAEASAPTEANPKTEPAPATDAAPTRADKVEPTADPEPAPRTTASAPAQPIEGPAALDQVLPCGLRVLVATDDSLPVASVVLAVEAGSEDDPAELAGLHHALAFALLQGNREFAPGDIAGMVHDAGGTTAIATGPGQTRFESLIPVTLLADVIAAEAGRLRAPTVLEPLWNDALTWARRDPARAWGVPHAALASAHRVPGLGRPGRQVSPELQKMPIAKVAQELSRRFAYNKSTLVVVAPHPVDATMALIKAHFSDLPPAARAVPDRTAHVEPRQGPLELAVPGGDGRSLVWPVAPDPASMAWAKVWCKTLNRQRRGSEESKRARVRCRLDEDPRRPTLIVRASAVPEPLQLIEGRVARMADGTDDKLMAAQRLVVRHELEGRARLPLSLARALATSSAAPPDLARSSSTQSPVSVNARIGLQSLGGTPPAGVDAVLTPRRAVLLMPQPKAEAK